MEPILLNPEHAERAINMVHNEQAASRTLELLNKALERESKIFWNGIHNDYREVPRGPQYGLHINYATGEVTLVEHIEVTPEEAT